MGAIPRRVLGPVSNGLGGRDGSSSQSLIGRLGEVFPLAPEPIVKGDGANEKNDCERNAAKRLLSDVRREHPHLRLVVVEDSLASNGPHIKLLKQLDMRFIVGAKRADHKALFEWVEATERVKPGAVKHLEHTDEHGVHHRFRSLNDVPLNDTHFELEVNFLEYWETRPDGKEQHFAWVTDLRIDDANVMALMRAARARWRIGNETFNTLKNQGYRFEHNFGHGHKHLSTVFAYEVIEIPANELDDEDAMVRHFRRLASYLRMRDVRNRVRDDRSWFRGLAGAPAKPVRPLLRLVTPAAEARYVNCVPLVPLQAGRGSVRRSARRSRRVRLGMGGARNGAVTAAGHVRGTGGREVDGASNTGSCVLPLREPRDGYPTREDGTRPVA